MVLGSDIEPQWAAAQCGRLADHFHIFIELRQPEVRLQLQSPETLRTRWSRYRNAHSTIPLDKGPRLAASFARTPPRQVAPGSLAQWR